MTTTAVLIGFTPLAMALEEGGDMLQPMAAAAIGGLLMEIPVALFLMPCLYVIASKKDVKGLQDIEMIQETEVKV